jgi:hypothetical protein
MVMLIAALFACNNADPETLVDELRIMAIQPNPAEIVPGFEGVEASFDVLVADPEEEGAEIMFWLCTNFGDGCLEADFHPDQPSAWIMSAERETETTTFTANFPAAWAGILGELPLEDQPFRASFAWALACRPGLCPVIGEAAAGNPDTEALAAPFDLAAELPIEGTSMAFRSLLVSGREESDRVRHPEITPLFDGELFQEPGGTVDLDFSYELNGTPNEDSRIYAYATRGGFMSNDPINSLLQLEEGETTVAWSTNEDEEQGAARIYVILENGEGGIGIWAGEGRVGAE